jgi:lipid A 3-O-deacylase
MISQGIKSLIICIALSMISLAVPADFFSMEKSPLDYKTFSFYLENDVFNGTDREYTNGVKLTWISQDLSDYREDTQVPEWSYPIIERLPFVNEPGLQRNVSFSIGQNMYGPEDIEQTELITDERPYAGITYLDVGFHSKNSMKMDSINMTLGILGPHSYSEDTQKTVHRWLDSTDPKGWDHQLKDEPILNLYLERKRKFLGSILGNGFAYDFIPHLGCSLGNAYTAGYLGGQARFGWNLPRDFGTFLIRPGSETNAPMDKQDPRFYPRFHRLGIHIFAGLDASAVAWNVLLDGNTFRDSHSVDKKPLVGNFIMGVGIILHRLKISYAHVYRTKEYDTQREEQRYGSVTISFSY